MAVNRNIYKTVRPLIYGCITGILCGGAVALFITCARVVCTFVFSAYSENGALACICLVMLCILACLLTAVVQTLCPSAKGSGIPLTEGCARGMLKVKWLRTLAALIAGSLLSFVCGMPLGSEGPSIGMGGLLGEGLGKITKKPTEFRRYMITGGMSAGLAVAFNAPLTGVTLALEETHRRFSPGILLSAFSAVVPAVLVSQLIFWGLGHNAYLYSLGLHEGFSVLPHFELAAYDGAGVFFIVCGIAAIAGILVALIAAAFNKSVFSLGKLFSKIKNPVLRLLPAFLLTAVCGLVLHSSIGSGEATLSSVTDKTAIWIIFALLAIRFILTVTASASGATGGLFLPMIAISGLSGILIARACVAMGLPQEFTGNIVMICIAAFFASSVRAPISAIVMAVELTASFSNLLPVTIAAGLATAIGGLLRAEPLYEHMMTELQKASPLPDGSRDVRVTGTVGETSVVCGKRIRDILWPYNSLVIGLERQNGKVIVPDGETFLYVGDKLTVLAESVVPEKFDAQISEYITTIDTSVDATVDNSTEKMLN